MLQGCRWALPNQTFHPRPAHVVDYRFRETEKKVSNEFQWSTTSFLNCQDKNANSTCDKPLYNPRWCSPRALLSFFPFCFLFLLYGGRATILKINQSTCKNKLISHFIALFSQSAAIQQREERKAVCNVSKISVLNQIGLILELSNSLRTIWQLHHKHLQTYYCNRVEERQCYSFIQCALAYQSNKMKNLLYFHSRVEYCLLTSLHLVPCIWHELITLQQQAAVTVALWKVDRQ